MILFYWNKSTITVWFCFFQFVFLDFIDTKNFHYFEFGQTPTPVRVRKVKTLERSIKGCCLWTKITWTIEIVELIKISNPFRLLLSKNNNKVKYNTSSKRLDEKRTNKVKEFKVMIVIVKRGLNKVLLVELIYCINVYQKTIKKIYQSSQILCASPLQCQKLNQLYHPLILHWILIDKVKINLK